MNAVQASNAGAYDGFLAELSAAGNSLQMATYLGGMGVDSANAVAVDSTGNIYVAGQTQSTDFPVANAIQVYRSSAMSTFVAKFGNGPAVVSGAPVSAVSTPQTFAFVVRDSLGYSDVYRVYFLINPTRTIPINTCHGFYDRASNAFYLYNDSLTVLQGPLLPGSSATLQNSQCSLYGSSSGVVSTAGTDLTINIGLGLQPAYRGTLGVYLWVKDNEGHDTGWVQTGNWTLPAGNSPPSVVSGTPASTSSTPTTFTFVARDPDGYADIYRIYFLINPAPTVPLNTCHGFYDRPSNAFYLYNDSLTILQGPLLPGASGTLQNSQCVLYGSSSALISAAGTDLTINIGLGVQPTYKGALGIYLWVKDNESHDTGWVQTGIWNMPVGNSPPAVVSGTPASTSSTPTTFAFVTRDPDGYADIYRIYFLVNPTPTIPINTCHGFYDRASNAFYLYNDSLTVLQGPLLPGSSATLQNS
jgi:hypothetical protein